MARQVQPWYRGPWPKLSRAVIARDRGLCRIGLPGCTTHATTADHVISIGDGGPWWDMSNLRAACLHCNVLRENLKRKGGEYAPSRQW